MGVMEGMGMRASLGEMMGWKMKLLFQNFRVVCVASYGGSNFPM